MEKVKYASFCVAEFVCVHILAVCLCSHIRQTTMFLVYVRLLMALLEMFYYCVGRSS
jgi:hypothetical protein